MHIIFFSLLYFLLASCASAPNNSNVNPPAPNYVSKEIYQNTSASIFEVVVPKVMDSFIKYERALPWEKESYSYRNDKYISIGTAFAIENNKFISAAHVFAFPMNYIDESFFLRDTNGNVFKIKNILRLSSHRDLIEFNLENTPPKIMPLKFSGHVEVADVVYVVGNALGDGISFRSGQVASFSPEEVNNDWKFIRFTAPASPGNSGGPLLSKDGEVIGVVVRKSQNENLNYAIPISELVKLPEGVVEYTFKDLLFTRDEHKESKNFKITEKTPITASDLTKKSIAKLTQFYNEFAESLYKEDDKRFFPANEKFKDFKHYQPLIEKVGILSSQDKGNTWGIDNLKSDLSLKITPDQQIKRYKNKKFDLLVFDKPMDKKITEMLNNSELLYSYFAKIYKISRFVGGEEIPVISMGPATHQEVVEDSLGRRWKSYQWKTRELNQFIRLDCLPMVSRIACSVNVTKLVHTGFGLDILAKKSLDEVLINYGGSMKEWQEFLKIDDGMKATFFKNVTVNFKEGSYFNYSDSKFNFKVKNLKTSANSTFIIRTQYSLENKIKLDYQGLDLYPDNQNWYEHYFIDKITNPTTTASEDQKSGWTKLKDKQGKFNGEIFTSKDYKKILLSYSTKDTTNSSKFIYYLACGNKLEIEPNEFSKKCSEVYEENKHFLN